MKPQELVKVGLSFAIAQGLMTATVANARQTFSKAPEFKKLIQKDTGKNCEGGSNCVGGGCMVAPIPENDVTK